MSSENDATRKRISDLVDDMTTTAAGLRARGMEPGQREDYEAARILKRIIEKAYRRGDGAQEAAE